MKVYLLCLLTIIPVLGTSALKKNKFDDDENVENLLQKLFTRGHYATWWRPSKQTQTPFSSNNNAMESYPYSSVNENVQSYSDNFSPYSSTNNMQQNISGLGGFQMFQQQSSDGVKKPAGSSCKSVVSYTCLPNLNQRRMLSQKQYEMQSIWPLQTMPQTILQRQTQQQTQTQSQGQSQRPTQGQAQIQNQEINYYPMNFNPNHGPVDPFKQNYVATYPLNPYKDDDEPQNENTGQISTQWPVVHSNVNCKRIVSYTCLPNNSLFQYSPVRSGLNNMKIFPYKSLKLLHDTDKILPRLMKLVRVNQSNEQIPGSNTNHTEEEKFTKNEEKLDKVTKLIQDDETKQNVDLKLNKGINQTNEQHDDQNSSLNSVKESEREPPNNDMNKELNTTQDNKKSTSEKNLKIFKSNQKSHLDSRFKLEEDILNTHKKTVINSKENIKQKLDDNYLKKVIIKRKPYTWVNPKPIESNQKNIQNINQELNDWELLKGPVLENWEALNLLNKILHPKIHSKNKPNTWQRTYNAKTESFRDQIPIQEVAYWDDTKPQELTYFLNKNEKQKSKFQMPKEMLSPLAQHKPIHKGQRYILNPNQWGNLQALVDLDYLTEELSPSVLYKMSVLKTQAHEHSEQLQTQKEPTRHQGLLYPNIIRKLKFNKLEKAIEDCDNLKQMEDIDQKKTIANRIIKLKPQRVHYQTLDRN